MIAYGIGTISPAAIPHWKLLFLILGAVTSGYGLVLLALLPDSPAKAIFLKPNERAIAIQRTLKNKTGVMDNGVFKWSQALQALQDPQTWLLVLNSFASNLANGGLTSVSVIPCPLVCYILTILVYIDYHCGLWFHGAQGPSNANAPGRRPNRILGDYLNHRDLYPIFPYLGNVSQHHCLYCGPDSHLEAEP